MPEDARELPLEGYGEDIYEFRKTLEEAGVKAIEAVARSLTPATTAE
ncbi:MAG: hypothetical protein ACLUEJ_13955 [Clostridium sp.]